MIYSFTRKTIQFFTGKLKDKHLKKRSIQYKDCVYPLKKNEFFFFLEKQVFVCLATGFVYLATGFVYLATGM